MLLKIFVKIFVKSILNYANKIYKNYLRKVTFFISSYFIYMTLALLNQNTFLYTIYTTL